MGTWVSADEFASETLNGLKEYSIEIGSTRWPKNSTIKCQNVVASGVPSAEHFMQAICSLDNTFAHMNAVTHSATNTGQFVYYNFCSNRSFASGVPIEDGKIHLVQVYNSAPTDSTMDVFLHLDAILRFDSIDFEVSTTKF